MKLSQADLADYLGVARATLSQATSNGHKCKGYPVRAWAVYDGAGRVSGYNVPTHVMQQASESVEEPRENSQPGRDSTSPTLFDLLGGENMPTPGEAYIRAMQSRQVDASQRTSLLPEGEDYSRTVSSGGAAYVVGTAIEHDNATSRGALFVVGTAVGGLTGYHVGDKSPTGALVGAGLGLFAAIMGVQSVGAERRREPNGMERAQLDPSRRVRGNEQLPTSTDASRGNY